MEENSVYKLIKLLHSELLGTGGKTTSFRSFGKVLENARGGCVSHSVSIPTKFSCYSSALGFFGVKSNAKNEFYLTCRDANFELQQLQGHSTTCR